MKKLLIVSIFLFTLLATGFTPATALVSRCADFTAIYNVDGEPQLAAYDYFMSMEGTPAYLLDDPIPQQDQFWEFPGLLHDKEPEKKGFLFGAVASVGDEIEPTFIVAGMLNPENPIPYLLIFDYGDPENVTLCDAFIITEKDALIMTVLTR